MSTDVAIPSYAATLLGGVAIGWALKALLAHGSSSSSAPCACAAACSACAAAAAPAAAAQAPADAKLPEQPPAEELKMVLCVNASLGMSKGKIGAQCAHAAVGITDRYRAANEATFWQWDATGHAKVALKVKDGADMAALAASAQEAGLFWYQVEDQGRTQIPAGSHTVLAVGPAPHSLVDEVTGHLTLL